MTKQALSILLILMMVVSPISLAFNQCANALMLGHASLNQNKEKHITIVNKHVLDDQKMDMVQSTIQDKKDCHSNNSCSFHFAAVYVVTLSSSITSIIPTQFNHSGYKYLSPHSTFILPDIRPPILFL